MDSWSFNQKSFTFKINKLPFEVPIITSYISLEGPTLVAVSVEFILN